MTPAGWRTMMMMMMIVNSAWTLPAPSRLSVQSTDMRHVLTWVQPETPCHVLYSVQFQGEFEVSFLNSSWLDSTDCQSVPHPHCDVTFDLGSDSDYNLRVRGQCGSETSTWTKLSPPFNRRHTVLSVPVMAVTAAGDALQVEFSRLPVTASIQVTVWRRGDQLQAAVFTLPAEQLVLTVSGLQLEDVYCVTAQSVLDERLHSTSTDQQCVALTAGGDSGWRKATAVTVTVVVTAGFLFAVCWSAVTCRTSAWREFFRKEPLPHSLEPDWEIQIPMSPEEAELCEPIHVGVDPKTPIS